MAGNINLQHLPDEALVRQRTIMPALPFSDATLWRRIKSGSFPAPHKIGGSEGNITCWRWGDVRAWLNSQSQEEAA